MIDALKALSQADQELAKTVQETLSRLQKNRRGITTLHYYRPLFDLLLIEGYAMNFDRPGVLTYREWTCLLLTALHDLPMEAIAWTMQISPSTLRTHLQRIRVKLNCLTLNSAWARLIKQGALVVSPVSAQVSTILPQIA